MNQSKWIQLKQFSHLQQKMFIAEEETDWEGLSELIDEMHQDTVRRKLLTKSTSVKEPKKPNLPDL